MVVADPVPVIQATLAPVFLVSGAGIFLNFLSARLFRVNDRLRQVAREKESAPDLPPVERSAYLSALTRRIRILRNAIVLGVVTLLFTMLTTILILLPTLAGYEAGAQATVVVFFIGLVSLAASLSLALYDTLLSVRMVEAEVAG